MKRITFLNAGTGFAVRQLKVRSQADLVPVLKTMPEVSAGEWLDAQGNWVIDQEYGRQFNSIMFGVNHDE